MGTVAVAVGTGVKRSKGQGKPHDRKIRRTTRFYENMGGNPGRILADQKGENARERHGDSKAGAKDFSPLAFMGSYVLGKGSLDGAAAEGKADAVDWMYHIVDAEPLGSDGTGKKNTVEKAQEAAEKAGSGEQQRAGEKGAFFFGKIGTEQHKSSPRPEILLQDMRFRPESELA